jgi:hypothetical protein
MNDLQRYFESNPGRMIDKWMHYFEIYERHFHSYRNLPITFVEIGVFQGGSLQMWKNYFGPEAMIYGIDINPLCKQFEEPGIQIIIGDQSDPVFLASLARELPAIDILLDDGGHTMRQQRATFEALFPKVAPTGVYVCEDLHTSYWPEYGGAHLDPRSFIEFSKQYIDRLNAFHTRDPESLPISEFTRMAHSMHYYDSMLVIEKRPRSAPESKRVGIPSIPDNLFGPSIP